MKELLALILFAVAMGSGKPSSHVPEPRVEPQLPQPTNDFEEKTPEKEDGTVDREWFRRGGRRGRILLV